MSSSVRPESPAPVGDAAARRTHPPALLVGASLVLVALLGLPTAVLLWRAVQPEAIQTLLAPAAAEALRLSLLTTGLSMGLTVLLGTPLAYLLARYRFRGRRLLDALVDLPVVLPPVVAGVALLLVFGRNGVIGGPLDDLGVPLAFTTAAVVLAQTFVASPFVVITAKAAFERVDPALEYASQSLGKSRLTTVRRVTLPIAWPGILAGITLAFARAIGEFGATIMLAYYPRTMPVQIWVSFTTLGLDNAFPVAVVLVGIAIVTLVVLNTLGSNPFE